MWRDSGRIFSGGLSPAGASSLKIPNPGLTVGFLTRLLLGYFIWGFGLSLLIGAVVAFVLKDVKINKSSAIPPEIEIVVGVLAVIVAILVGTGFSATIRDKEQARHPDAKLPNLDTPSSPDGPRGIESMPEFDKLPGRVKTALSKESPWVAWVAGLAVGMPTAYNLAAIAAILKSGSSASMQIVPLVVFNVVAFAQAEIPIIGYLVVSQATRGKTEQVYAWVSSHQRVVVTVLAGVVGLYLLVVGFGKV